MQKVQLLYEWLPVVVRPPPIINMSFKWHLLLNTCVNFNQFLMEWFFVSFLRLFEIKRINLEDCLTDQKEQKYY